MLKVMTCVGNIAKGEEWKGREKGEKEMELCSGGF